MATELAKRVPNFRIGTKKIYLPNHVVTLIRNEHQPPDWATFKVPIRFNKFDLRDYLWHLYGVETTKVRSSIRRRMIPVENSQGILHRPAPEKYMTVTMTEPFVWPAKPTDLSPWDHESFTIRNKATEEQHKQMRKRQLKGVIEELNKKSLDRAAKAISERAKRLLSGEEKWDNNLQLDEKWEKILGKKKAVDFTPDSGESVGGLKSEEEKEVRK